MSRKYLRVGSGNAPFQEAEAINSSAGAGDANKVVATNTAGKIDITLFPSGIAGDIYVVIAGENISAGDLVSISSANTVVRADADNNRIAHGIALEAITAAATGEVAFGSYVASGFSGLTPGTKYYLSTTPGTITATIPTGAGVLVQPVGVAKANDEFYFEPSMAVIERV
jgi:hypothetical protein